MILRLIRRIPLWRDLLRVVVSEVEPRRGLGLAQDDGEPFDAPRQQAELAQGGEPAEPRSLRQKRIRLRRRTMIPPPDGLRRRRSSRCSGRSAASLRRLAFGLPAGGGMMPPPTTRFRYAQAATCCSLLVLCGVVVAGCGYSARSGLAGHLRTVYVQPFVNEIDLTSLTAGYQRFPVYRHGMESDVTKEVVNRFQFTGLMRPAGPDHADSRLEGELVEFRRDSLRFDADQQVEEWRLSVVVNVRFYDLHAKILLWEEERLTGDATYFELGANAESEVTARDRAVKDLARRVVERVIENW